MNTELENQFYKELGSNIANARKRKRLNQDNLAKELGLSRTSMVNIEKGRQRPSIYNVWQICITLQEDLKKIVPSFPEELEQVNSIMEELTKKGIKDAINSNIIDFVISNKKVKSNWKSNE